MNPDKLSKRLHESIAEIRSARGVSQRELARRMTLLGYEIPQPKIALIEKGDRRVTAIELRYIAEALNVELSDLIPRPLSWEDREVIRQEHGF